MAESSEPEDAVRILQELGLKEYEAKCFVALSRLPKGTAKEISTISDVPRTRVYDATRVLESKGLIEVQHSNPQLFRAVSIESAVETLETEYESRVAELEHVLQSIDCVETNETDSEQQEVWALSGKPAIATRIIDLVDAATSEVTILIESEAALENEILESLSQAAERGVAVQVRTVSEEVRDGVAADTSGVDVSVTDYGWLLESTLIADEATLTKVLSVDGETILVSSIHPVDGDSTEFATLGSGLKNGLVVLVRRLLAAEPSADP
jgi:sugar-specific transcriptional regulator TrmB